LNDGQFAAPADQGTDTPSTTDFDDQRTATYAPPPEPHNSWAPAGWGVQTPPHWFEPIAQPQPVRRRRPRRGGNLAALFVVALLAALLGSAMTYAALVATNHLGEPVANLVQPTPSITALPDASALTGGATPAPVAPAANTTITDAAHKVSPAVVTITVTTGSQPADPSALPIDTGVGVGSGILFDANGYILTNRHVVTDASKVSVELNDGRTVDGTVYGIDTLTDLAIVKIEVSNVPFAPIGDSSTLEPGQTAIVIGSPLGTFTNSVTSGVISALGRSLVVTDPVTGEQRRLRNLVQTDAAINPGNSGGPLIDAAGEVVGVSTAYAEGAQGIFFAIPINIAKPIMAQAVAGQPLTRPWIGIVYTPIDHNVADDNKLPVDYGAWISADTSSGDPPIVAGSPAEKAGLQAGDIITSIDGHRIDAGAGLDDVLSQYKPNDTLTLEVLRGGQTISVQVTLGTRPADLN
jgi:S1-C subfamily serine protease